MDLNATKTGNFLVVDINGRLDTSNYLELEKHLMGIIEKGDKNLVINCSGLTYVSSSGLRVLLMALKKITAEGGKFHICALQTSILEIFEIAGFTTIFKIFGSLAEATQ